MVHVTLHTALRKVFGQLTEEAILAKARLADQFMSGLMQPEKAAVRHCIKARALASCQPACNPASRQPAQSLTPGSAIRPRIGVCSLNPHGGEGGLFGDEEQTIIRPGRRDGDWPKGCGWKGRCRPIR